jgi:hypothetical protein
LPQRLYHKTNEKHESFYLVKGFSKNWATAGFLLLATIAAAAIPR